MSLFFDQGWFDDRLAQLGLNKSVVAATLGLSEEAVEEMWKDQREITPEGVVSLSNLLGVPAETIANRAGVSTPVPKANTQVGRDEQSRLEGQLATISNRLDGLEQNVADLKQLVIGLAKK